MGRLQVRIVIARMTNELPGPVGDAFRNRAKQGLVERAGNFDAERAIGGDEAFAVHRSVKLSREGAQNSHLRESGPQTRSSQELVRSHGKPGAKRIADGSQPAFLCRLQ